MLVLRFKVGATNLRRKFARSTVIVDDSLKYGLPGGLLSFGLLLMTGNEGLDAWIRWNLTAMVVLPISLFFIRKKNVAYFPFSFAFLSGFNVSILMILLHAALLLLFGGDLLPAPPSEDIATKWLFFQVFQESIGFLFIAMVVLLFTSLIFMRRKKT